MKLIIALIAGALLSGCTAKYKRILPDGTTTELAIPFGYKFDERNQLLESDERIVKATSDAFVEVAKQSPAIAREIIKEASDNNKIVEGNK